MTKPRTQEVAPTSHGGALKNTETHGCRKLEARFKAGQELDLRTRHGKLYKEVLAATLSMVHDRLGQEPDALTYMAVEAVAQAYLVQRLHFNHAVNHAQDDLPNLGRRYTSHFNNLGKALDRLGRMLGASPEAIGKSMAERLAEMAKPAEPKPIEAEVVDHD